MPVSFPGLRALRNKVEGLVVGKLGGLGAALVGEAQQNAPEDTGELRSKITFEVDVGTMTLRLIAGAPHSLFQEFGTSRMRAHPFMRPALAQAPRLWRSLGNTELAFPTTPEPYSLAPGRHTGLGRASVTIRGSRPFGGRAS